MKNILKRVVTVALAAVTLVSSLTVGSINASASTTTDTGVVFWPASVSSTKTTGALLYPRTGYYVQLNDDTSITNVSITKNRNSRTGKYYVNEISTSDSNIKLWDKNNEASKFHLRAYNRSKPELMLVEFVYKYKGKNRVARGYVNIDTIQGGFDMDFGQLYFTTKTVGKRSDYVNVINTLTGETKKMKGSSKIMVLGYTYKDGVRYYKFKKTLTDKSTGKKASVDFLVNVNDTYGERR